MTQDEIIEMAKECGLVGMRPHLDGIYFEALEDFAKLIAKHERNEIIEILDASTGYVHMDVIRERT